MNILKKIALAILVILSTNGICQEIIFNQYFLEKTLRIDLAHTGNKKEEIFGLVNLKSINSWAGTKTNLVNALNYGNYKISIIDILSNTEIYNNNFSNLFFEWQTTQEASQTNRTFFETVLIPFPKNKVKLEIYRREFKNGTWESKFSTIINPYDYMISQDEFTKYPIKTIHGNGNPNKTIDITILPEGYSNNELDKFVTDCQAFSDELLSYPPFNEYQKNFNIKAVLAPSAESGIDIPNEGIWKNTLFDFSFSSLGIERYVMTNSLFKIHDVAANTTYDLVYILVNSDKYGGGAIYNHYASSVMKNQFSKGIFIHEFGHLFGGLGDEYYTKMTTYNNMYNLKIEPWEPNITTLINFKNKWQSQIDKNTPIPTPRDIQFDNTIGVFEGGGYTAKGIYSPFQNCLMKTIDSKEFCPVCKKALEKMIRFYIE